MNDFRMDSHKLMYHVGRVNKWLDGEDIYPIYVEISPSGACNHRCSFCALDYLEYKSFFLDKNILNDFFSQAKDLGIKSIMYAGEGEPLLHKDIAELIINTKKNEIDVAISTNGVLLKEDIVYKCLSSLSWLRISLNAGTPDNYAKIHRCDPEDFKRVLKNIDKAVEFKRKNNSSCVIGVQLVLFNENIDDLEILASILKDKGVDYFVIKPFSPHPRSQSKVSNHFNYDFCLKLEEKIKKYSNKYFKIIFRSNAIKKTKEDKYYKQCLGLPFFSHISSDGNVYPCVTFLNDDKFCYGNIYENSFSDIWKGEKRKEVIQFMSNEFNIEECRRACRLDSINEYLWELKHPSSHVNFI